MDKQVHKKGLSGSDHLAESESIESLMTKRGPYKLDYSSSKRLVAQQSIRNIIRNNKLLATRKGNFNGDDVNAVVGVADHLKYGEGKVLFDRSITKDYKKHNIDPNVSKSVISTINTHQLTDFKVKDNKNRETVSGKINKYTSPLYKFKGVDARGHKYEIIYGSSKTKKTKNFMKHSEINRRNSMGEIINGVYVPSNEDLLQHYGKKGMKWKKRKNPLAEASEALTEDLAYAADKRAIDEHVKDALRDKQTVDRNMEDNIKKIKSGVRNGKTLDPAEQKYHDAYMRNAKASTKVAQILEARRKHAKDMAAAHAKDVKNRRK